ncbi:MAG: hypothetical protein HY291_02015 [Planctomycetes bacterium]|nr:hypothetical protein [Planctomycetota bacterium]
MGDPEAEIESGLGIMQKIAGSLMSGLLVFTAVTVLVVAPGNPSPTPEEMSFPIPAIGLIMCLVMLPISFVVKGVVLKQPLSSGSLDERIARYRSGTIIALALCEGAGFALLLTTIVAGAHYVSWAACVLIPLAGMIMHFPTRTKFEQSFEDAGPS